MNDYGPLIGPDSFSKRSHEPRQGLRWTGDAEIWPGSEVEVLYHSLHITLRHVIFFILIGNSTQKRSDKLYICEKSLVKQAITHSAQHEFRDTPIRIMCLVEYRDADISVINGQSIHRPVVIALFSALLNASR